MPAVQSKLKSSEQSSEQSNIRLDVVLATVEKALLDVGRTFHDAGLFCCEEFGEFVRNLPDVLHGGYRLQLQAEPVIFRWCPWLRDALRHMRTNLLSSMQSVPYVMAMILCLYSAFVFVYMPAAGICLFSETSILFHACMFLLLASYTKAARTDPGTVPKTAEWTTRGVPPPAAAARGEWCERSRCYKPPRSGYCDYVGMRVLRKDHECPWVGNTIGFHNHKYFFCFLLYAASLCSYTGFSLLHLLLHVMVPPLAGFTLASCGALALLLSALLVPFLGFHGWLLAKNLTTKECFASWAEMSSTFKSPYDCGLYHNLASVLGDEPLLWLVPVGGPSGDGLSFRVREAGSSDDLERQDQDVTPQASESDAAVQAGDQGVRTSRASDSARPSATETVRLYTPAEERPAAAVGPAAAAGAEGALIFTDAILHIPCTADKLATREADQDWRCFDVEEALDFLATETKAMVMQDVPEGARTVGSFLSSFFTCTREGQASHPSL